MSQPTVVHDDAVGMGILPFPVIEDGASVAELSVAETPASQVPAISPGSLGGRALANALAALSADGLVAWLSCTAATALVLGSGRSAADGVWWALAWTAPWIAAALAARAYPGYGLDPAERLRRTAIACAAACPSLAAALLAANVAVLPSVLTVLSAAAFALPLSQLARQALYAVLARRRAWGVPVTIIGDGPAALELLRTLLSRPDLGYRPGAAAEADLAIVALPELAESERGQLLEGPLARFRRVLFVIAHPARDAAWAGARHLGSLSALELRRRHLEPGDLRFKRALDLFLALLALPLLLPLVALIALAIALDSRGPVLYGATRMGWRGRPFRCWKFRSMHADAEVRLVKLLERDPEAREQYARYHKLTNDPRVTRVGRLLRRSSLDELPQIVNVVLGEMSLVGPRPYLPRERPDIEPHADIVLSCRPGLTGWWQVSGRNAARFDERVLMDLHYVRRWSPWLDFLILAATVRTVLRGKGAY